MRHRREKQRQIYETQKRKTKTDNNDLNRRFQPEWETSYGII